MCTRCKVVFVYVYMLYISVVRTKGDLSRKSEKKNRDVHYDLHMPPTVKCLKVERAVGPSTFLFSERTAARLSWTFRTSAKLTSFLRVYNFIAKTKTPYRFDGRTRPVTRHTITFKRSAPERVLAASKPLLFDYYSRRYVRCRITKETETISVS